MGFVTFLDALRIRVEEQPNREIYTFLSDGETEGGRLTFGELDQRARAIAERLRLAGAAGERALLLYPPGLDFITAFLGCLYGGVVAIPTYPPRLNRPQPRLWAILRDGEPRYVLTTSAILRRAEKLARHTPELAALRYLATDAAALPEQEAADLAAPWRAPRLGSESLAFLQYTSGSTATPKGVMVSHGNLLHNEEMIRRAFEQSADSVVVSWLPLYHDMGLIGGVLQPLYTGARCILMSPFAFLQKPLRWLAAVSRYRATTSGGPNFAYELCARRVGPEERARLDLGSWRVAFNGAEPVRPETLKRFAAAFAGCGFRPEAFYPCYGLAEATLFVSGGTAEKRATVASFDAEALAANRAVTAAEGAAASRELVSCGGAWAQRLTVVDPETGRPAPPQEVGEIWVAGPSVARGYWRRPEQTARDFGARLAAGAEGSERGPYLRTGDLGFLHQGELYVTGRLKDLIILRGRNHYPQDVELTAERAHPGLRPGCGAAFSVDVEGEERLVVVQEVERRHAAAAPEAAQAIRRAVVEEHEVNVYDVVLIRHGSVAKTTSGKIRRRACRDAWLAGELRVIDRSTQDTAAAEAPAELDPSPEDLAALEPAERETFLSDYLGQQVVRLTGLGAAQVAPDQPFSALGLDSLAAVELKNEVESRFGVPVSLEDLLAGATPAALAREILRRIATAEPAPPPIGEAAAAAVGEPLPGEPRSAGPRSAEPVSRGQAALWFLDRLQPGNPAYVIAGAARVRGALDTAALRRSFEVLTARHEALRATFEARDGQPRQRFRPGEVWLRDHGGSGGWFLEEDLAAADLPARLAAEAGRPFSLAEGPLLRLAVFHCGAEEHAILLSVHHVVADFWSLGVLLGELRTLYREGGKAAVPLEPPGLGYGDYVRWQARMLESPRGEKLWSYWRRQLAGLPDLDLLADRPRPAVQTHNCSFLNSLHPPYFPKILGRQDNLSSEFSLFGAGV